MATEDGGEGGEEVRKIIGNDHLISDDRLTVSKLVLVGVGGVLEAQNVKLYFVYSM